MTTGEETGRNAVCENTQDEYESPTNYSIRSLTLMFMILKVAPDCEMSSARIGLIRGLIVLIFYVLQK